MGAVTDRVGQVWRVLDEDDRVAGVVLVVESVQVRRTWTDHGWRSCEHRLAVLWEAAEGYVSWCVDGDEEGRIFLLEGEDGEVESNAERLL